MQRLSRFFLAATAVVAVLTAPLHGLTVEEVKALESKVKQVVSKNLPAVVGLFGDNVPGAGSGVVVSEDGLILTAAHVSKGNNVMQVYFPDGKSYKGKVLGADYTRDVSLIKIEEPGKYPFVEVGDSDKLEPTTMVIALGHPGGFDAKRTPPVRIGRISNKNMGGFLVSDCTLVSGDSGGPLFDLEGRVIGIHSSISQDLDFNRDAPVNAAKAGWDKMLASESWGSMEGFSNRGRRGNRGRNAEEPKKADNAKKAEPAPAGEDLTKRPAFGGQFQNGSSLGVTIGEVVAKSPLDLAGLQSGDVLTQAGDREVKTTKDLIELLAKAKPGDKLEVTYLRDGEEHDAEITLASKAAIELLERDQPKTR